MKPEEFDAIIANISAATMLRLLTSATILTDIESKRAEVARAQETRQSVIDAHDAALRTLNTELAALIAQSNIAL